MQTEIINLTQHWITEEQREAGVENLPEDKMEKLKKLLTFDEVPTQDELIRRAEKIGDMLMGVEFWGRQTQMKAMIGGFQPFMPVLAQMLMRRFGIKSVYAFTKRVVVEDGNGNKTSTFKHVGFVDHPYGLRV